MTIKSPKEQLITKEKCEINSMASEVTGSWGFAIHRNLTGMLERLVTLK